MRALILVLCLWGAAARADGVEVLMKGALVQDQLGDVRQRVTLDHWQKTVTGGEGHIAVEAIQSGVDVAARVDCAAGSLHWLAWNGAMPATEAGGIVTRVGAEGYVEATFADGRKSYWPQGAAEEELVKLANDVSDDALKAEASPERDNAFNAGYFLATHPELAFALTMVLYARACP
jgi:hypothetical protein